VIQVRVLPFGVLKDWLGAPAAAVELPEGATVTELLDRLSEGRQNGALGGIAVSVNAEFAEPHRTLRDGDEVGLLPPVSGGTMTREGAPHSTPDSTQDHRVALTRAIIDTDHLVREAKRGEDGAVVVFDGIVRNHTRGRPTLHLEYEAYEEMALKQMTQLAAEARTRFAVRHVTILHRLGRLEIGETSVLIIVASAHRAAAFDACRWLIDTLKKTVPIWKKEFFHDGAVWSAGEPFPDGVAVKPEGADVS
jgi:molybdopterin synthase catalytic subunit/molybdopterin converting factor small subunit